MCVFDCVAAVQEFDLDPESDSDQVDELLSLCLRQALSQAKSNDKDSSSVDADTAADADAAAACSDAAAAAAVSSEWAMVILGLIASTVTLAQLIGWRRLSWQFYVHLSLILL